MIEIRTTYGCEYVWHEPRYFHLPTINFNHTQVRINGKVFTKDSLVLRAAIFEESQKKKMWEKLRA